MNKLLFYIFSLLLIVSCASDNIEDSIMTDNNLPATELDENKGEEDTLWMTAVGATVPDLELYGDEGETRALTFDYENRIMKFTWHQGANSREGDLIGVFPTKIEGRDSEETQQIEFGLTQDPLVVSDHSVTGTFQSNDNSITTLEANTLYLSYAPYISEEGNGDFHYTNVPVTYLDQMQASNVDMDAYFKKTDESEMTKYKDSETAASAHLTKYDYLASAATTRGMGGVHFDYTRLGSVVRFYLKVPDDIKYDQIQVVNTKAKFMTKGTMNVKTKTLNAENSSHVVTLKLGETGLESSLSTTNSTRYIVAYMMFAPINLKTSEIPNCSLYLCGHTKTEPSIKKYYKANSLTKINIAQNKVQQWAPTIGSDEPITFNAISVEEWKEGTTFSNGDDGKGTEGW